MMRGLIGGGERKKKKRKVWGELHSPRGVGLFNR